MARMRGLKIFELIIIDVKDRHATTPLVGGLYEVKAP